MSSHSDNKPSQAPVNPESKELLQNPFSEAVKVRFPSVTGPNEGLDQIPHFDLKPAATPAVKQSPTVKQGETPRR